MNNCSLPAIEADKPIPTPPVTTKAPDVDEIEAVVFVILTVPPIFAFPVIPKPPTTTNDPVDDDNEFIEPLPICV